VPDLVSDGVTYTKAILGLGSADDSGLPTLSPAAAAAADAPGNKAKGTSFGKGTKLHDGGEAPQRSKKSRKSGSSPERSIDAGKIPTKPSRRSPPGGKKSKPKPKPSSRGDEETGLLGSAME
jgi:hypothetical protein